MNESELVFNKNGVSVYEHKISPFTYKEGWILIDQISYDALSSMSNGLNITVKSIKPVVKDGILVELRFQINDFSNIKTKNKEEKLLFIEKMPPDIAKRLEENKDRWPEYYQTYTRQLYEPSTLPHLIRTTIKDKGLISDTELNDIIKKHGYEISGGKPASIKVLETVTQEVKVEGRGENKIYIWVGKSNW